MMLSFEQALTYLLDAAKPVGDVETVSLKAALGRVLATEQKARVSMPPHDNSAMDGYAVRVVDVPEPGVCLPVSQRIPAGVVGDNLQPGTCARIFTGAPVPLGADAVVMQEQCEQGSVGVLFNISPKEGQNIRLAGEDFCADQVVLQAGQRLLPQHLGLAAAAGLGSLPVLRRLRVAIFLTGDELFEPGSPLPPGGIYNSNRYTLNGFLESLGCDVTDLGQVPDTLEATRQALRQVAQSHDLVLTSGGVSVGEEDHVKAALEAEGRVDLWKIAMKPGKPLAFGYLRHAGGETCFMGLPGNPVATFVTFLLLVRPFILRQQGEKATLPNTRLVPAGFAIGKPDSRLEFLRVRLDEAGRLMICGNQSSGALTSTVRAEGLAFIPPDKPVAEGDLLEYLPFSEVL